MSEEIKLEVHAGACRFKTVIIGTPHEDGSVSLKIKSECPEVRKMAACMPEFDAMEALTAKLPSNPVILHTGEHLSHPSCPVPFAIIKVLESGSGMALQKDVTLNYRSSSP